MGKVKPKGAAYILMGAVLTAVVVGFVYVGMIINHIGKVIYTMEETLPYMATIDDYDRLFGEEAPTDEEE